MKKQLGALHKIEYAIIISAIIAATVTIASAFESSLETSHKNLSQRHSDELSKVITVSSSASAQSQSASNTPHAQTCDLSKSEQQKALDTFLIDLMDNEINNDTVTKTFTQIKLKDDLQSKLKLAYDELASCDANCTDKINTFINIFAITPDAKAHLEGLDDITSYELFKTIVKNIDHATVNTGVIQQNFGAQATNKLMDLHKTGYDMNPENLIKAGADVNERYDNERSQINLSAAILNASGSDHDSEGKRFDAIIKASSADSINYKHEYTYNNVQYYYRAVNWLALAGENERLIQLAAMPGVKVNVFDSYNTSPLYVLAWQIYSCSVENKYCRSDLASAKAAFNFLLGKADDAVLSTKEKDVAYWLKRAGDYATTELLAVYKKRNEDPLKDAYDELASCNTNCTDKINTFINTFAITPDAKAHLEGLDDITSDELFKTIVKNIDHATVNTGVIQQNFGEQATNKLMYLHSTGYDMNPENLIKAGADVNERYDDERSLITMSAAILNTSGSDHDSEGKRFDAIIKASSADSINYKHEYTYNNVQYYYRAVNRLAWAGENERLIQLAAMPGVKVNVFDSYNTSPLYVLAWQIYSCSVENKYCRSDLDSAKAAFNFLLGKADDYDPILSAKNAQRDVAYWLGRAGDDAKTELMLTCKKRGPISHSYDPANLDSNGHYTIPDCVTHIADNAFENNTEIESVTIPSSVTEIGVRAFAETSLTSVTIPSSVTEIGVRAFYKSALKSVIIPDSVTKIPYMAFAETSLTSVTIPSSVTTIEEGAFYNTALTSVDIPNSVTTIGEWAFAETSLTSVTIPNSVTTIEDYAFYNTGLISVTIPDSVTMIEDYAFADTKLKSVTILGTTPKIYSNAFRNALCSSAEDSGNFPNSITEWNLHNWRDNC